MATQTDLANISRDGAFLARVEFLMVKAAIAKLNQETVTAEDTLLSQRILKSQERVQSWALATVTNPSISMGAHALDGSTIVDNDLEFTVNSLWTAFAK